MRAVGARLTFLLSLVLLVGCDHGTKYVAKAGLEGSSPHTLIRGVLDLRYVENTDVAFNLFRPGELPQKSKDNPCHDDPSICVKHPLRPVRQVNGLVRPKESEQMKVALDIDGTITEHPEFFAVLDHALARGFRQVYVNTNGIRLADRSFVERLAGRGRRVSVYLQFDGFKRTTLELLRGRGDLLERIARGRLLRRFAPSIHSARPRTSNEMISRPAPGVISLTR